MPRLADFVSLEELRALIARARDEDLGPDGHDLTTRCFVRPDVTGRAMLSCRQAGVIAGLPLLPMVAAVFEAPLQIDLRMQDGDAADPGQVLATLGGPRWAILQVERTALNFLTHLSGVATLTRRYVQAVAGTRARIYDTRKTLPGLRGLQRYAVACGGGMNHRRGLFDAVLVKDNHLAGVGVDSLAAWLGPGLEQARRHPGLRFVEVEVDRLEQLSQVLQCAVDVVLLDNMPPPVLGQAVALRDRLAPQVELEASGGVNLDTVRAIARTGVDRISVGALTHSAPALDLGLDMD